MPCSGATDTQDVLSEPRQLRSVSRVSVSAWCRLIRPPADCVLCDANSEHARYKTATKLDGAQEGAADQILVSVLCVLSTSAPAEPSSPSHPSAYSGTISLLSFSNSQQTSISTPLTALSVSVPATSPTSTPASTPAPARTPTAPFPAAPSASSTELLCVECSGGSGQ